MKHFLKISTAVLMIAAIPALVLAQSKPDFSGRWVYQQLKSGLGTGGNAPVVNFATELGIKQTPSELHVNATTVRQNATTAVYKLDGSEVASETDGITEKARASWDGPRLVISSRRSFQSPIGVVATEFKEMWTLNGTTLTIEKTSSAQGVSDTEKAVYEKQPPK